MDELLLPPEHVGIACISVNEDGPYVLSHNLTPEFINASDQEQLELYLGQLSMTTIVSLGQGHKYVTGVFEFPCTPNPELRLIIVSTRIKDYSSGDSRLLVGYFHFIFFISSKALQRVRNLVTIEEQLEKIITRRISHSGEINLESLLEIRDRVVATIRHHII